MINRCVIFPSLKPGRQPSAESVPLPCGVVEPVAEAQDWPSNRCGEKTASASDMPRARSVTPTSERAHFRRGVPQPSIQQAADGLVDQVEAVGDLPEPDQHGGTQQPGQNRFGVGEAIGNTASAGPRAGKNQRTEPERPECKNCRADKQQLKRFPAGSGR